MTRIPIGSPFEILRAEPRWVAWRVGLRLHKKTGERKPTKVPYTPGTARFASVNDPRTWGTYEAAVAMHGCDGVGFVLTDHENVSAADLDHCLDPQTGILTPWAAALIEAGDSYVEISPSGTGLHLWGLDDCHLVQTFVLPRGSNGEKVETYIRHGRYLTVTGKPYGEVKPLRDISSALRPLIAEREGARGAAQEEAREDETAASLDGLAADIVTLIRHGARPGADRSVEMFKVVGVMRRAGFASGKIVATLRAYPQGIAARCFERGRDDLARQVHLCLDKIDDEAARQQARQKRGASSSAPDALVRMLPPPSNPMAVARIFAAIELTHIDGLTLRYWRGSWWEWTGPHWRELHPRHIRGRLYCFTEHAVYDSGDKSNPWAPTQRKVADLLEALGAVCFLPDAIEAPAWLDRRSSGLVVSCANGLLDIESRRLAAHTPLFFNVVSTTVDFLADAKPPTRWLGFLDALWPDLECGERERAECAVLGEWFGYVLSGRTDLHRILLMVGPTRGGKGVIARVLTTLIGKGNVAGPTLSSLGKDFGLAPLIGKPLAIISDARMGKRDNNLVVERLLSISGEDTLTIDIKYREQWTGRLPTRLYVVSNELPRLGDASAAIIGRFLVLLATESWLGREDLTLEPALHEERSGILSWALDGLTRLANNGWRFTPNPAAADAIVQLRDLAAPVAAFVRDRCVVDSDAEVEIGSLYSDWRAWCDNNGQVKTTRQTFGRDLKAAYPMLKIKQPRDGSERHRVYAGIGLRPGSA